LQFAIYGKQWIRFIFSRLQASFRLAAKCQRGNVARQVVTNNLATASLLRYTMSMANLVVQMNSAEYRDFVSFLTDRGFERVVLHVPGARFMGKVQLLWQYMQGTLRLAARWRQLRGADHIVAFGHFAYAIKLLARLGLIGYRKLFCFAFFVHDPKLFPLCRQLVRLDGKNDLYLVFSRSELELYREQLGIEERRLVYLPYGDWGQFNWQARTDWAEPTRDYYLAGGSSNRDYVGLVEAFRSIRARLVIVCAQQNWEELRDLDIPENVAVLQDVASDVFEALVRGSKAGIIPLKLDTGASGQSVALALMRNSKCVIASDVGALREYVDHGVSGFLLRTLAELPETIRDIEQKALVDAMGRAARRKYDQQFSRQVVAGAFDELLAAA
jgi:glycosyltransferase involved in cell wall biosynthesis